MKLENQVCTLEQAKRLKELGVYQESTFSWVAHKQTALPIPVVYYCGQIEDHQKEFGAGAFGIIVVAAAFTIAELRVMFGRGTAESELFYRSVQEDMNRSHSFTIALTPEFAAGCLIAMLELRQVTSEEINQRLLAA